LTREVTQSATSQTAHHARRGGVVTVVTNSGTSDSTQDHACHLSTILVARGGHSHLSRRDINNFHRFHSLDAIHGVSRVNVGAIAVTVFDDAARHGKGESQGGGAE